MKHVVTFLQLCCDVLRLNREAVIKGRKGQDSDLMKGLGGERVSLFELCHLSVAAWVSYYCLDATPTETQLCGAAAMARLID